MKSYGDTEPTDLARAEAFKSELKDLIVPLLEKMDEIKKDGFEVEFNIAADAAGRSVLARLSLLKRF